MASEEKSKNTQRALEAVVRPQILISFCAMLIYFYIGYYYVPISVHFEDPSMLDRMVFTLRWVPLTTLPIIIMIIVVGNIRGRNLTTAGDPSSPGQFNPPVIAVHTRVLANTLEQTLIHIPALFAFASYVQPENLKLVPLVVILFFVGRMIYWIGYVQYPFYRALGFAMALFPSMIMTGYSIFSLFHSGVTYGMSLE